MGVKMRSQTDSRLLRVGLTMLLGAVMAVTLIPMEHAWAADKAGGKDKAAAYGEIAAGAVNESPFNYEEGQPLQAQEGGNAYPASFDLRNVNGKSYVTPVRLQNPFGTCWGFGATATAESSILADADLNKGLDAKTFDLSEKHLAWFTASHINNPADAQNGEGTFFYGNDNDAEVHYNTGGYQGFATLCYAAGIGPVPESFFPYRGANGDVASWRVATSYDADGNPLKYEYKDVWYSADDDWTIPESYRFGNSYRLEDSLILPSPAQRAADGSYAFNEAGVNAIKEQIADHHRAVSICFTAESYVPGQDTSGKLYMSSNWAHYTWKQNAANHVVTIVGWDDNYPKENFLEGHQPPGNGAFLMKNSWGSELNDFPNNAYRHWGLLQGKDGVPYDSNAKAVSDRATGYFWISYYDQSLDDPEAFDFDQINNEFGYYVEQNDFMIMGDIGARVIENVKTANVFEAEATSELSGISVMTTTPGTDISYEIYLLRGGYTGPTDGIKLTEGTAGFKYGGYHRINLEPSQRAVLAKGQDYSVIVTEKTPSGQNYFPYSTGIKKDSMYAKMFGFYNKAVINPGESYCYAANDWYDLSDVDLQNAIMGSASKNSVMDNFLIKSYLEPVVKDGREFTGYLKVSNWSLGAPGTFTFQQGDAPLTLTAEFRGTKTGDPAINADIVWSCSDPSLFAVSPKADNAAQAVVTPAGTPGIAYLTVDAGSYGKRVVGIAMQQPWVPAAKITSLKVKGGGKLQVNVKDQKTLGVTGYQINFRVKGSSAWKTSKMSASKTSKVLSGLKKGKRYQVRVRGFQAVSGKNYYGAWSSVKTSGKIR